jgi:hypothetical protein
MLPQIALGHSQSEILGAAIFENNILDLTMIMLPPLNTNTMSGSDMLNKDKEKGAAKAETGNAKEKQAGRPEKPETEKSDKTLANKESM